MINFYRQHLQEIKPSTSGWFIAHCPFHNDNRASFTFEGKTGNWSCHAGCGKGTVKDFAKRINVEPPGNGTGKSSSGKGTIVKTYDYVDEAGKLLYQSCRYEPKDFRQRRPDGKGGWIWNLAGVSRAPYNLPAVLKADVIYIVEGEKDVESLRSLGLTASCNSGGAGKWTHELTQYFKDKTVIIFPDNDEPGRKHAEQVAANLQVVAASIKIVTLPGLPDKGDVTDWILQGHTKDELQKLVDAQPAEVSTAPQKMKFITLDALLKEPPEVVPWLVDGLLPAGGFSLMSAKPKVAKSTLARQEALAVARGDLFLGRETQQGAVIYCVFEEKRAEVADHFRVMGAEGEENIHFFFDVAPENLIEQLREKIKEVNPVLIILDTLFKGIRVKDLNDYAQTTACLEPLLDLTRKSGAHVQGLHHEKKTYSDEAGGRVLGSTGIYAQFDTIISISRNPVDNKRTIQSIQRYGEDMPPTFLMFDKNTRMTTIGGTVGEIKIHELREAALHYLGLCDNGATEHEINANIEGRKEMKVKTIRELLRDGDIFRTGEGKRNCPFRYFINSEISQDYKVNIKKVVPVVPEYKSSAANGEKDAVFVSGISGSHLSKEPWEPETSIVFPNENFDYKNTGSRGSLSLGTCKKCDHFSADGYCRQYGKSAATVMHCMKKEEALRRST